MSFCWACGGTNCTITHNEEDKRNPSSHCQRCGSYTTTYECQTCLELVCQDCGLKGYGAGEPDTGYYVCGKCC